LTGVDGVAEDEPTLLEPSVNIDAMLLEVSECIVPRETEVSLTRSNPPK
jgi:hypothetical protein